MDFSLERTTDILRRTPRVLDALLRDADPAWTHSDYGPGTWSAYHVLGHLIVGERSDWIARARIILTHGLTRPFDPFPHDATLPHAHSLNSLLDTFAALRAENLVTLASFNLTPHHLSLRGTHPALGQVTLSQLLSTWAVHDLHHLRQISLAMAYQARNLVGPWRAYLNTLPAAD